MKAETPCAVESDDLLCLPPIRKSERTPLLAALHPFTDAPRPKESPPEPEEPALVYVVWLTVAGRAEFGHVSATHTALMIFAGWLIMVIAAGQGAPFWFKLLQNFTKR